MGKSTMLKSLRLLALPIPLLAASSPSGRYCFKPYAGVTSPVK
jgi:hypothetical protein